ncbi:putative nuclease HARBI1 isoform X2 [Musca domestica]|uniref:Nuclease HARBI1 isoform X2 n=1 Tax=Musca domestica TaxID=7370 RepID=A0ABM3VNU6_MUSDO|nr:putative nuclease HARBI1 isoform X2 [Musca domestica]
MLQIHWSFQILKGSYQKGIGRDYQVTMAQSTFSEVLSEFLNAVENSICQQWITYPTRDESKIYAQAFYSKFGIPGVLGCTDGTHIVIISPKEGKHLYYNRKGRFSLNVTLICDHEMRIRFMDTTHPGGCNDSFVWSMSPIRKEMERSFGRRNKHVVVR